MREFEYINRYLAPLAAKVPGARGLRDDAATLPQNEGQEWVVTTDGMSEGVHFLPDSAPDVVANRLLACNLSDLAAMGAEPAYAFITAFLPQRLSDVWLEVLTEYLAKGMESSGLALAGGDTVRHAGPLCLSMTAVGTVPESTALHRDAAQVGQFLYVSGTIGDAALGLKLLQGMEVDFSLSECASLMAAYESPTAQVALGMALREEELAMACCDISDGLLADAMRIAEASQCGVEIQADAVPLSDIVKRLVAERLELRETCFTGGDDYELLFTVEEGKQAEIAALSTRLGVKLTCIGRVVEADMPELRLVDGNGMMITPQQLGYEHEG